MLGSVATLMHEAYLPVYLSDELHLRHGKVGCVQCSAVQCSAGQCSAGQCSAVQCWQIQR